MGYELLHLLTACGVFTIFGEASKDSETAESDNENAEANEFANNNDWIGPEFGVIPEGGYFIASTKNYWNILIYTCVGLVFAIPFLVYDQLLEEALFQGQNFTTESVVQYARAELNGGIGFQISALGFVTALLAFSAFLWTRFRIHADLQNLSHTNRHLSLEERRYLSSAIDKLFSYFDDFKNIRIWQTAYYGQLLLWGGLTVTSPFLVIPIEDRVFEWLINGIGVDSNIIATTGPGNIYGAIPMYLLGFSICWSLVYLLGGRVQRYAEYLYGYTGWENVNDPQGEIHSLALSVARYLRLGKLKLDAPFDPKQFLRSAFLENRTRTYVITMFAFGAVLAGIYVDVGRYAIVTDTAIKYSRLHDTTVRTATFADVERVELRCFFYGTGDPPKGKLGLGYRLMREGEFAIDLLNDRELTEVYLSQVERIDARLTNAGTLFSPADKASFLLRNRDVIASGCVERIHDDYSPDVAARILDLLRLPQ